LKKSEFEKDLGVLVSNDLKPSRHVAAVALKANNVVGIIKRNFEYLDKGSFHLISAAKMRFLQVFVI
jgi:hypothetical protein